METPALQPGELIAAQPARSPQVKRSLIWATVGVLAAFWAALIYQVSADWRVVPEYAYGWSVPWLAAFLFWKRWITRPAPEPQGAPILVCAAALTLALCYLPIRLLEEANPDWRMLTWAQALQVVSLTLFALFYAGGLRWLRHFWFCVAFFLVAVPWSRGAEQWLTKTLMPVLAQMTCEALVWFNIPSVRQGNLIEIANGIVGIDEACSGIRSVQATLMASLFLGDLYRFRWSRRFLLVVVGALLAFLFNGVRAFFLAYVAAKEGINASVGFHDPAGFTILYISFGFLWAMSWLFRGRVDVTHRAESSAGARVLPGPLLAGIAAMLLLAEFGTQAWFISHEKNLVKTPAWSIDWPQREGLREIPIPPATRSTLGFDSGHGVDWVEPDGTKWAFFFLRWEQGNPLIKGVKYHKPDICMPAAGRTLERDLGTEVLNIKGHKIPMRWFLFKEYGRPLYAFYCLSEDYTWPSTQPFSMESNSRWSMIQRALEGKRGHFAQQIVQGFVSGFDNEKAARAAFINLLSEAVQ